MEKPEGDGVGGAGRCCPLRSRPGGSWATPAWGEGVGKTRRVKGGGERHPAGRGKPVRELEKEWVSWEDREDRRVSVQRFAGSCCLEGWESTGGLDCREVCSWQRTVRRGLRLH